MKRTEFEQISKRDRLNTFLEGYSYFARVHTPNYSPYENFGNYPRYTLQLGLEGEWLQTARDYGLTVYEPTKKIPYHHVEVKRDVKDMNNPEIVKPEVIDSKRNEIPSDILIGNGSYVRVKFGRFYHGNTSSDEVKTGGGVGTSLFKVQVKSLVPYVPNDGFDTEEEGFSVDSVPSSQRTSSDNVVPFDEEESLNTGGGASDEIDESTLFDD